MYLGRIVGRVWSTVKNAEFEGQRFLVVQPITPEGVSVGKRIVCTDMTGAGTGETIYWVRGREASFALPQTDVPADLTIVGIVDEMHVNRAAKE
jgi:microcompartment protein CcmK/EutM